MQTYTSRILAKGLAASVRHVPRTNIRPFYTFNVTVAAPPLVERERRTDRGGGAVGIRKAEPLPDKINQRQNPLYACPSLRRRLRNQHRLRSSLTTHLQTSLFRYMRAQRRCDVNDYSPLPQFIRGRHNSHICLNQTIRSHWIDLL